MKKKTISCKKKEMKLKIIATLKEKRKCATKQEEQLLQ